MSAKLKGTQVVLRKLSSDQRRHKEDIMKSTAEYLTYTRRKAEEHIRPNPTGDLNPYFARKKMINMGYPPTVSGRLTSKTGKLKLMLRDKATGSLLKDWSGFKGKIAKQSSMALHSTVRMKGLHDYTGQIRVFIKGDPRLFDTSRGQPQESMRTLAIRFNWEFGIRGSKRPIFEPVAQNSLDFLIKKLNERNAITWR